MINSWDYCDKLDKNCMINPKNRNISHLRNLKTWDSLMPPVVLRRGKSSLALSSGWGTKRNSPQNGRDESTDVHTEEYHHHPHPKEATFMSSDVIRCHQMSSDVIRCHQMSYFCIENPHFSRFENRTPFHPNHRCCGQVSDLSWTLWRRLLGVF